MPTYGDTILQACWALHRRLSTINRGYGNFVQPYHYPSGHPTCSQAHRSGSQKGELAGGNSSVKPNNHRRKWDNAPNKSGNTNSPQQHHHQQLSQQQCKTERAKHQSSFSPNTHSPSNYLGKNPLCQKWNRHHPPGPYEHVRCSRCGKMGHLVKDCTVNLTANPPAPTTDAPKGCFGCGKPGHFKKYCPHFGGNGNGNNNNHHHNNNNDNNKAGLLSLDRAKQGKILTSLPVRFV